MVVESKALYDQVCVSSRGDAGSLAQNLLMSEAQEMEMLDGTLIKVVDLISMLLPVNDISVWRPAGGGFLQVQRE